MHTLKKNLVLLFFSRVSMYFKNSAAFSGPTMSANASSLDPDDSDFYK